MKRSLSKSKSLMKIRIQMKKIKTEKIRIKIQISRVSKIIRNPLKIQSNKEIDPELVAAKVAPYFDRPGT